MVIWSSPSVDELPRISLSRWRVLRTGEGTLHLVGFNVDRGTGRVSTPVAHFDSACVTALTASGRVYELVGPTGDNDDTEFVWVGWAVANHVCEWKDVTEELLSLGFDKLALRGRVVH